MGDTVIVKEWKKFRRYKDGAEYYGFSQSIFERLAKDAGDEDVNIDGCLLQALVDGRSEMEMVVRRNGYVKGRTSKGRCKKRKSSKYKNEAGGLCEG